MPVLPSPLVSAAELAAMLPDVCVLDARSGAAGRAAYRSRHVQGAAHADLDRDLAGSADHPEQGGRHPLPPLSEWAATLGAWGIAPESQVAIYDDQGGANAAARAWWMLRAVGHRRVAVVDGGLAALAESGVPMDDGAAAPPARSPYPVPPDWLLPTIDANAVDRCRQDASFLVVDVRAPERFRGEAEPIDPVAGHIPGACNAPYAANLGADGCFLSAPELAARYQALLGDRDPARVIVHCGSGVTACHSLVALELAGLSGASLYVGSFGQWCRQSRPIGRGER